MKRTRLIHMAILLAFAGFLSACEWSEENYFSWKLKSSEKKQYLITISGSAIMEHDLFGLDEYRLAGKKNLSVTMNVKSQSYLIINKKKQDVFEVQHVSGLTEYSSFPDLEKIKYAKEALAEMFDVRKGIELAKFNMGKKGSKEAPDFNRFLSLNMYLRLPEDSLLQEKKAVLPKLSILGDEEICLQLFNRKVRERTLETRITLNSLTRQDNGDLVADMNYRIVEKIQTEFQEGDFAKRRFIKRFNDANIFSDYKIKLNDDNMQKTYICDYQGRHFFNLTQGWLEGLESEQSIRVIKTDISPKAAEIFRVKTSIIPTDEKIDVLDEVDEMLMRTDSEEEDKKKRTHPTVTEMLSPVDGGGLGDLIKKNTETDNNESERPK